MTRKFVKRSTFTLILVLGLLPFKNNAYTVKHCWSLLQWTGVEPGSTTYKICYANSKVSIILVCIVVSNPACHAGDRGPIPPRRVDIFDL